MRAKRAAAAGQMASTLAAVTGPVEYQRLATPGLRRPPHSSYAQKHERRMDRIPTHPGRRECRSSSGLDRVVAALSVAAWDPSGASHPRGPDLDVRPRIAAIRTYNDPVYPRLLDCPLVHGSGGSSVKLPRCGIDPGPLGDSSPMSPGTACCRPRDRRQGRLGGRGSGRHGARFPPVSLPSSSPRMPKACLVGH